MATSYGFSPKQLSPALWLADKGNDPAIWEDLSGNGRHATQANAGNRPAIVTVTLNGRQVRRFDGGDWMQQTNTILSNISGASLFAVRKFSSSPSIQNSIVRINMPSASYRVRAGLIGGIPTSGKSSLYARRVSTDVSPTIATSSADVSTSSFEIQSGVVNYTSGSIAQFINGSSAGTASLPTTGNSETVLDETIIGNDVPTGTSYFNGDIAEILVFPTALSTSNRQLIEKYLSTKYNIPLT